MQGSIHSVSFAQEMSNLVQNTKITFRVCRSVHLFGLEVNADKTKYMVMSRDRNAGRGHRVKTDNTSIERVEEFK